MNNRHGYVMAVKYNGIMNTPLVYSILQYTHEHGEMKASDLYDTIARHKAIDERLIFLVDEGMLEYRTTVTGRIHKEYRLTEKGKLFIKTLEIAYSISRDSVKMDEAKLKDSLDSILSVTSFSHLASDKGGSS